ncbi:MAG: DUF5916 domain-containing protein, partial [Cyclobacteriaceae bacterium]
DWGRNENISIYFDSFNDLTNGFTFGLSAAGAQREGLIVNGSDVAEDWDNKWYSAVKHYGDRWEFEMSIPLTTIRYDPKAPNWNLSILRNNLKDNERSSWTTIPQGFSASSLAFAGELMFSSPLPKAGTNISVIPYIAARSVRSYGESSSRNDEFAAGADAKVAVTSSLNLDLTFNPDFSQVEVDRQQTNLSRFELFFPERRQFFLENEDLFGQSGFNGTRPFFSRRIGIASDTSGGVKQIPILYGARLSGKVGRDWRIGLLNMQTREENNAKLTGANSPEGGFKLFPQNYTVGVIQRRIFSRSNIGAIFVIRKSVGSVLSEGESTTTSFNRVFGLDYNLLSADGRWEGDFFVHHSFDEEQPRDAFAGGAFLRYQRTKFDVFLISEIVGAGYNAETGFVRRKDIMRLRNSFSYRFYPERGAVNFHGPSAGYSLISDLDLNLTDYDYQAGYEVRLVSSASAQINVERNYELLRRDFNPIGGDTTGLKAGTDYEWTSVRLGISTDNRKLLSGRVSIRQGGFYSGKRFNLSANINYRLPPVFNLSLDADLNVLNMPEGEQVIWLLGPKLELTFTDKLFLTTFVQYNDQRKNINLNVRLQWRYKPVSDFFVVYTDNYISESLVTKDRAVVAKFTYWLNI